MHLGSTYLVHVIFRHYSKTCSKWTTRNINSTNFYENPVIRGGTTSLIKNDTGGVYIVFEINEK